MTTPHMITTTTDLAALCDSLQAVPFITVDTEFMRESTYYPQLCLIQISGPNPETAHCIDPLADGIDLSPLHALLSNTAVLKVFHAARQDLEIFAKAMGCLPEPLFDTQIAAMVCGFGDSIGYDNIAQKITGAQIDKSSRFTDWSRRPLTEKQIDYALADVTHLIKIYEHLAAKLAASGRTPWLQEEMNILSDMNTYITTPEEAWQRLKPRSTKPRFLAVLQKIAAWREQEAQARDLPRGRILRDESLEEIAAHPPADLDALSKIRGVSKGWAEGKLGPALLAAVAEGMAVPLEQAPAPISSTRPAQYAQAVVELLKVLLHHVSESEGVAARLIATTSDLEWIAASDTGPTPALQGWRGELFGSKALALKHGKLAISVQKGRTIIREI